MSVLQGGKGARKRRADERYYAAVGRQLLVLDRGIYKDRRTSFGVPIEVLCTMPAPIEEFLRREHRAVGVDKTGIDFRSWAVKA